MRLKSHNNLTESTMCVCVCVFVCVPHVRRHHGNHAEECGHQSSLRRLGVVCVCVSYVCVCVCERECQRLIAP